jgi:lipoprotein-releasing system ATP-binding protein
MQAESFFLLTPFNICLPKIKLVFLPGSEKKDMLKALNIKKSYGDLPVLKGIDLTVKSAEVVSIVGASGAGKSTLLHILGTLDKPDEGTLFLEDVNITKLEGDDLARFRNQYIGFIFQFHNLLPEFTALENVCMPAIIGKKDLAAAEKRAKELLTLLNLGHRMGHKPSEMSGGEQQRAAVARSLINNPKIVFADEPSGNLDSQNASELHDLFFKLRNELGQSFVIVTHNREFANMANRVVEIKDGKILTDHAGTHAVS